MSKQSLIGVISVISVIIVLFSGCFELEKKEDHSEDWWIYDDIVGEKNMEWTDISDIKGGRIEQAKVEAQRQIAEQLEKLNKNIIGLMIGSK